MLEENLVDSSRLQSHQTTQEETTAEAETTETNSLGTANKKPDSNLAIQQQLQQTTSNQAIRQLVEGNTHTGEAAAGPARLQRTVKYRTAMGGQRRYYSTHDPSRSFAIKASAENYDAQLADPNAVEDIEMVSLPSVSQTSARSTSSNPRKRRMEVDPSLIMDGPRAKKVNVNNLPLHFEDPAYIAEAAHSHAGGSHSRAILGPRSFVDRNSDANPSLPQAIIAARAKYPAASFKAGHLLNATFLGDGQNSHNLTILTASANGIMRAFDERVKDAVRTLEKLYQALSDAYIDVSDVKYGIEVNIRVSPNKWHATTYPDNCIAREVIGTVSKRGSLPDISGLGEREQKLITDLDGKITDYLNRANAAGRIPNDPPA